MSNLFVIKFKSTPSKWQEKNDSFKSNRKKKLHLTNQWQLFIQFWWKNEKIRITWVNWSKLKQLRPSSVCSILIHRKKYLMRVWTASFWILTTLYQSFNLASISVHTPTCFITTLVSNSALTREVESIFITGWSVNARKRAGLSSQKYGWDFAQFV